jgi:hypothetical protein
MNKYEIKYSFGLKFKSDRKLWVTEYETLRVSAINLKDAIKQAKQFNRNRKVKRPPINIVETYLLA